MAKKNRVFYGSQVAQIKPATTGHYFTNYYQPLGVQSVGLNSTFDTQQTFQLGALDLYDISENVPNVEVTISKFLDGTSPLYLMCMGGQSGISGANCTSFEADQLVDKGIGALANNFVDFRLGIYDGVETSSNGNTKDYVECPRMYLSRFTYTFPVDGNATEEVVLVGNNKSWNQNKAVDSQAPGYVVGDPVQGLMQGYPFDGYTLTASKLARRQFIGYELPTGNGGMPTGVANHLQNITISASLGRDNIIELGAFAPRTRYATFPIEVTSEFEVVATVGDYVNARDFLDVSGCNINYRNLKMLPITVTVCGNTGTFEKQGADASYLSLYLGSGNQLTAVNYNGGDTSGGNATVTYSFRNYNEFFMRATNIYGSGANLNTIP